MLKLTTRVEESEGFAYLSQALYGWLQRGGPPASRYMVSPDHADPASWVSWQMIFDESERIAGVLSRKRWVDVGEVSSLYSAIRGANIYRPKVGKKMVYDGI
jgi:hypothetical protein